MHQRNLLCSSLLLLLICLAGCGTTATSDLQNVTPAAVELDADRTASATYTKFFEDTVGLNSGAKWSIANSSGNKQWALSNTAYSAPKAWVIGQNYWNGENDRLTSVGFNIADPDENGPNGTSDIRFTFQGRWQIAAGDYGRVDYSTDNGMSWTQLQAFTAGSNANWPNWTKYTYALPDNFSGADKTYRVRFRFSSNASGTSWGFGVDNISVYQRELGVPLNFNASDSVLDVIELDWDHPADANQLTPDGYEVWISDDIGETYQYHTTVSYPTNSYNHFLGAEGDFYYKVRAVKLGYRPGPFSNADMGQSTGDE
jgi:hypothetical protein